MRLAARLASLIVLAVAGTAWAAAPAGAAVSHLGLSYDLDSPVSDPNLNALDIYQPDGAAPGDGRPVVVYVHGGGWSIGDKANQIQRKVDLFTGSGYVFASVNYRLSPSDGQPPDPGRVRFPAHPHDVGEAIGWLARNVETYGGDPTRILLVGHSAGAHLVSLVSTDPSYVRAYGVEPWQLIGTVSLDTDAHDIGDRISEGNPQAQAILFNAFATAQENAAEATWGRASPITWADQTDPPYLLVTQESKPGRIVDNAAMATALGQDPAGVLAVPYDHAGINAALGDPADTAGETSAVMTFAQSALASAKAPKAKLRKHPRKRVATNRDRAKLTFRLAANQAGAGFECRLDSRKLRPCSARERLRVGAGRHTFRYRALSERGRPGAVKRFRFRVLAG